jgi:parallel beta-helix repeat protein
LYRSGPQALQAGFDQEAPQLDDFLTSAFDNWPTLRIGSDAHGTSHRRPIRELESACGSSHRERRQEMEGIRGIQFRQPHILCALAIMLVDCSDRPTAPRYNDTPRFASIQVTDPSTVLIVDGVAVPRHVAVHGNVAGIVVVVDGATVDLSDARVDCSQQPAPSDTVGIWIKGGSSRVHLTGGGAGVVSGCTIGVLIGPLDPTSTEPGGHGNHVDGLVIQDTRAGTGDCLLKSCAIALSNSHGNVVDHNTIVNSNEGGIVVSGSNRAAAVSGNNTISSNTIQGTGDLGVIVSTDGNMVSDNTAVGWFWGIVVNGNRNHVAGNQVGYLGISCGCVGIWLTDGADSNVVSQNVELEKVGAIGNQYFLVEATALGNVLSENTATTTHGLDAFDRSGDCINNRWTDNTFTTREPACIR